MRDDDLTGQIATKIPLDTDFRRYGMNVFSFFMVTLKAAWTIASGIMGARNDEAIRWTQAKKDLFFA